MELEHLFRLTNELLVMQAVLASVLLPGLAGRADLYRSFVRNLASWVVTFGPVGLLIYVLCEVVRLS